MRRLLFLVVALFALLLMLAATPRVQAQSDNFCAPGQEPAFVLGFQQLKNRLGERMGEPAECEHYDGDGNAFQQTTTGEAFFEKSTGTLVFTRGNQHWAITEQGLVSWTGEGRTPPASATPVSDTAPAPGIATLDWPYYGNDLGGMRYVDFDQINPANVAQLQPAWIFHTGVGDGATSFESQPIIIGGTMYVTSPHGHVYALDAATGNLKWSYTPTMPPLGTMAICCGQTNRGAAVGDGKVFVALLDATLVALDAATGQEVWKTAVADWREGWTETMAPQYVEGKVLIGASGGEFMKRGHLTAYDADTGEQIWRFYTVPGPGEIGHDTWAGDSWRTGGATVWTTPSVDPDLGMVYLSTGNAAPDLNGSERAGDNLFAASVVAVDLDTGEYRWHFQEVHHDLWDYDGPSPPHLFTLEKDGQRTPAVAHCNKNGYYFILDRRTGAPLYEVTETPVPTDPAWQNASPTQPIPATEPLIPHSVPTVPEGMSAAEFYQPPQEEPMIFQPGAESGCEWGAVAYSPRTRYAYIPAGGLEAWLVRSVPESLNTLGSILSQPVDGIEHYGLFDALDTTTGKIAWQTRVPNRVVTSPAVAGDLVFWGQSNGQFNASDARSGEILWSYRSDREGVGGANGQAAVYVVDGREYVVMAFGGNSQVRTGQNSPPGDALIAFALPQEGGAGPSVVRANTTQVEEGGLPESAFRPGQSRPPADATVVRIETHDLSYFPSEFAVKPGETVAVHLVNTGLDPTGFQVDLPAGAIALDGAVDPGSETYFVFTAPQQPGDYVFKGNEFVVWLGMVGTMHVTPSGEPPAPSDVIQPSISVPLIVQSQARLGQVVVSPTLGSAIEVHIEVSGFEAGPGGDHAVQITSAGQCEAPRFDSVGEVVAELAPMQFAPDGTGSYRATTSTIAFAALSDSNGSSLILRADTDPTSDIIGCAVLRQGR